MGSVRFSCGGFGCTRGALCVLNVLYMVVGLVLIGVAASSFSTVSMSVIGGVIAVASLLFLIAVLGLVATLRHHQVLLFFYMLILLIIFIVQLGVFCACLALNKEQQLGLLKVGWNHMSPSTRQRIESRYHCCGFNNTDQVVNSTEGQPLSPCLEVLQIFLDQVLQVAGGVGLFFAFTEILSVWLTWRYRNLKNPEADPNAFL
uniref:tetraspanin-31-like n=1 Tax=Myxine glutinosa TaxID=7769 RepID=UPI00358E1E17